MATRHSPGEVIAGEYELLTPVHVGGMAEVWHACGLSTPRDVAIKFPRTAILEDGDEWRRLEREAENLAAVRSRHVAEFIEVGTDHLVMEFVDGVDLATTLLRRRTLGPSEVARFVGECADGLAAAHLEGVLHRDVKPSNIMLSSRGAVLTDFGVSHAVGQGRITAVGHVMGTAEYMAPELIAGVPASPASDVYALGICAFEALTGAVPFRGPNPVQTALAHVDLPAPGLPATVPAFLRDLVAAMLAKDPVLRPTTLRVGAWARELVDSANTLTAPEGADTLEGDVHGASPADHTNPQHTEEDKW